MESSSSVKLKQQQGIQKITPEASKVLGQAHTNFQQAWTFLVNADQSRKTKFISSLLGQRILYLQKQFCQSAYLRSNASEFNESKEGLQNVTNSSQRVLQSVNKLVQRGYFENLGENLKFQVDLLEIQDSIQNCVDQIKKLPKISLKEKVISKSEFDLVTLMNKVDEKINFLKKEVKNLTEEAVVARFSKFSNEFVYAVFASGLQKVESITTSDLSRFLHQWAQQIEEKNYNQDQMLSIVQFIAQDGDHQTFNPEKVRLFIDYFWCNLEWRIEMQDFKIQNVKPLKDCVLKVIKFNPESHWNQDTSIVIHQNGQVDIKNPFKKQKDQPFEENYSYARFGRETALLQVRNDVYYSPKENKISRRQFYIYANKMKGQYEITCNSEVNATEFLVCPGFDYQIQPHSIIGIQNELFLEIVSLKPFQEKVEQKDVMKQIEETTNQSIGMTWDEVTQQPDLTIIDESTQQNKEEYSEQSELSKNYQDDETVNNYGEELSSDNIRREFRIEFKVDYSRDIKNNRGYKKGYEKNQEQLRKANPSIVFDDRESIKIGTDPSSDYVLIIPNIKQKIQFEISYENDDKWYIKCQHQDFGITTALKSSQQITQVQYSIAYPIKKGQIIVTQDTQFQVESDGK